MRSLLTGTPSIQPTSYGSSESPSTARRSLAHALQAGRFLARSAGARLRVITVFRPGTFGAIATMRTGGSSANEIARKGLRKELDAALAEETEGVAIEGSFQAGAPGDVLARESAELDLLVTGSRGYGPRAAVLLGSTTHALMRGAAYPGLITPRSVELDLDEKRPRRSNA